ncbi:hypothetical protein KFL_008960020 [Klebsormidium nitens]|uniref:FHA domain-containing protein n=1 Tax=Klebsormidium nitens TaxID=105231 RepID=A0A1Y1IUR5_KLENI|nr:hypothetical protein KFL_008960020 [Klebsormidium nitens]|eukprot:GAQ91978.1 hypothetical protein KFL_008960020 [Klebsormidium nitens]
MRAWWYALRLQQAEKEAEIADLNYAQAEEFARRMEMEEGRAVMRFWWLDCQLRALDPARPPPPPLNRTRRKQSVRQAVLSGRQGKLGPASEKPPAPSKPKTIITKDAARAQALAVPLDELVSIEVQKERDAARRKVLEAQAERQRTMDVGRAAMRKWWIQEREATKRALGLPPYGPVWTVVRKDGKEGPISIGKMPLIVGSDVSRMEKVVPVQLDYPTVSRVHAKIFGKEVFSYGEYVREYFVVDLKSTNGVRLNRTFRLRPGDEYRLSDGDTLFLGEEAATLVIKNPQKSP